MVDVRSDQELFRVAHQSEASPVVSASFRTDGQAHLLATAHTSGTILVWDFEPEASEDEGEAAFTSSPCRIAHVLRNAHEGSISSIAWVPGQALLVSTGDDNAVKVRLRWLHRR